jgi:catalase
MSANRPTASAELLEQIVTALRTLAGPHPGFRPAHAKGLLCEGTFRASAEAARLTRAAHLQGQPVAARVRFSNGSGDPDVHDGLPNNRALAVKFALAAGGTADVLANTVDGFPVRTPEEFLAFLQTQLPDPVTGKADETRLPRYLEGHPEARAFVERLTKKPVPASYATASYHSAVAFRFTAADGSSRFVRYHWLPEAGESYLAPDDAGRLAPNFLREEFAGRLEAGPVTFRLTVQVAAPDDPTDDPTALWPADRPVVELGRLEIRSISPTGAADERHLVFDPANLTDGIELSGDPILLARSPAYSISYDRRSRGE